MWLLIFISLNYTQPIVVKDYSLLPYPLRSKAECEEHIRKTKALNPNGKFIPVCFEVIE